MCIGITSLLFHALKQERQMDDIEKTRVTHVHQMELRLQHLQQEHDRYKAIAEKWEPVITTKTDPATQKSTFGLRFGGKNVQATVTSQYLCEMDTTTAISAIVDALVESLVVSQLRQVVAPELERVQASAKATVGAGKW